MKSPAQQTLLAAKPRQVPQSFMLQECAILASALCADDTLPGNIVTRFHSALLVTGALQCRLLASSQNWALLLQGGGSTDSAGVYVGVSYSEYAQLAAAQTTSVSTYTATGGSLSVAAGTDVSCVAFQL